MDSTVIDFKIKIVAIRVSDAIEITEIFTLRSSKTAKNNRAGAFNRAKNNVALDSFIFQNNSLEA